MLGDTEEGIADTPVMTDERRLCLRNTIRFVLDRTAQAEHRRGLVLMISGLLMLACIGLLALQLWPRSEQSFRHTGPVTDIAFTPDGHIVATGTRDIRLWDVASGQLLRVIQGHSDWVVGVAFAPDEQTLATASWDQTIKLWRASDGALLATLRGHTDLVWGVAFAPDGQTLASAGEDGTIRLWRAFADAPWPPRRRQKRRVRAGWAIACVRRSRWHRQALARRRWSASPDDDRAHRRGVARGGCAKWRNDRVECVG